jgi:ATP-dependent DNA helicase RecQ
MKVLIVAKTRRGGGACVGAITEQGRSVRLIAADAETNEHAGLEYEVGDVWEIESRPDPQIVPPHVENIIITWARKVDRSKRLEELIHRYMPPVSGGPEQLFDGLAQVAPSGALYIAERTGLPKRSTMFWVPDQALELDCTGKRLHYRCGKGDRGLSIVFVGFQEPLESIPAGTLLRVSLAHWWRPKDKPDEEQRCYVQLSGWFLKNADRARTSCPRSDAVKWSGHGLDDARQALKRTFGYGEFLPLQANIIARVLEGKHALAVMPTGGGKSLCYQLPALMLDGLTVVVSPLIALMEDQVRQLLQLNIPAAFLNSTLAHQDYLTITNYVRKGDVKILYTAPETLLRPETVMLMEQSRLCCLAVDEAHCISEWGHDFRPDYRQLQAVRGRFPHAICLALTATATARVRDDIAQLLGIPPEGRFVASFNRPNLFLRVEPHGNALTQTLAFLERNRGESGIIYCATRRKVDELTTILNANGWPALPYHAGLEDAVRQTNQSRFINDEVQLIIATIAFGMGINKANVRFVLHYNLPKDLESYYQEIGRAGRDGRPAECLLLFSRRDATIIRRFIQQGAAAERAGREERLTAMLRFAETRACRRISLLAYFGESFAGSCMECDNCRPFHTRAVIKKEPILIPAPQQPSRHSGKERPTAPHPKLFERLRDLRKRLADQEGVPPFFIFSDRVLVEMTISLPRDEREFLAIKGVGPMKLARYGAEFLRVINDYCRVRKFN